MKKLNSLKLNQLSKTAIEKAEMGLISGGICYCAANCSCSYSQSSSSDSYYPTENSNWYANLGANGRGSSAS